MGRWSILASAVTLILTATGASRAAIAWHQYDFEPIGGVTEPGWTHVDYSFSIATPTTPGFVEPDTVAYVDADRGGSTQAPMSVTRDLIIFYAPALDPSLPRAVFRDIIPANSLDIVKYAIYRSDPIDVGLVDFVTKVSINGGPQITIDSGLAGFGTYRPPITGTLTVPVSPTIGTIDFYFYDALNHGIRLNGLETTFPEPASALALVGLLGLCTIRRTHAHA
jgi:hypothetical protein